MTQLDWLFSPGGSSSPSSSVSSQGGVDQSVEWDDPVVGRERWRRRPPVARTPGRRVRGGRIVEATREPARPSRATVVIRAGWQLAGVEGPVEVAGPDDPLKGIDGDRLPLLLREIFTAAGGTHDDFDEHDRIMAEERRVAVLVDPERVYGPS